MASSSFGHLFEARVGDLGVVKSFEVSVILLGKRFERFLQLGHLLEARVGDFVMVHNYKHSILLGHLLEARVGDLGADTKYPNQSHVLEARVGDCFALESHVI